MPYRVIQWATGNVGKSAIEGVLAHPELELVGVKVYNDDKDGVDVGEICGIDPVGEGWAQSEVRYYIYGFLFVIFDVESVFLFPWARVFESLGYTAVVEMGVFIGILAVGLLYAWRKGVLRWV